MITKRFVAGVIRLLFALMSLAPQKNVVAFLSRQSARPFDFQLLEPVLAQKLPGYRFEWACVRRGGHLGVGLFLRQLYLVATSCVCLVDGYVPAASIPKSHRSVCIQVWHASGAIKKFGYQCLDTPAGRSSADAKAFRMHRGYDRIVAGMAGAQEAFAQAFDADPALVLPLGLPSLDYLLGEAFADQRAKDCAAIRKRLSISEGTHIVLYAPTFRRGIADSAWLDKNIAALSDAFAGEDVRILVSGHPLDEDLLSKVGRGKGAPVSALNARTGKALPLADVVISDYSSIALDAGALGKPVLFYVPDIAEYRTSPGLNIDVLESFPGEAFTDAHDLAQAAKMIIGTPEARISAFAAFMHKYAGGLNADSTHAIAEMISGIIAQDK